MLVQLHNALQSNWQPGREATQSTSADPLVQLNVTFGASPHSVNKQIYIKLIHNQP